MYIPMMKRLSKKEIEKYRHAWEKRTSAERMLQLKRKDEARKTAKRLAKILVEKYKAQRVYLIGSTASEAEYDERSDIDLVVESLRDDLFFRSYAELISKSQFSVDLIPLEDSFSGMKDVVLKEGICLYEKK